MVSTEHRAQDIVNVEEIMGSYMHISPVWCMPPCIPPYLILVLCTGGPAPDNFTSDVYRRTLNLTEYKIVAHASWWITCLLNLSHV